MNINELKQNTELVKKYDELVANVDKFLSAKFETSHSGCILQTQKFNKDTGKCEKVVGSKFITGYMIFKLMCREFFIWDENIKWVPNENSDYYATSSVENESNSTFELAIHDNVVKLKARSVVDTNDFTNCIKESLDALLQFGHSEHAEVLELMNYVNEK